MQLKKAPLSSLSSLSFRNVIMCDNKTSLAKNEKHLFSISMISSTPQFLTLKSLAFDNQPEWTPFMHFFYIFAGYLTLQC